MIKEENKILKIVISKEKIKKFNKMKEEEGNKSESKYGKHIIEKYIKEYEEKNGEIRIPEE